MQQNDAETLCQVLSEMMNYWHYYDINGSPNTDKKLLDSTLNVCDVQ